MIWAPKYPEALSSSFAVRRTPNPLSSVSSRRCPRRAAGAAGGRGAAPVRASDGKNIAIRPLAYVKGADFEKYAELRELSTIP
jgi:hypothetical protein